MTDELPCMAGDMGEVSLLVLAIPDNDALDGVTATLPTGRDEVGREEAADEVPLRSCLDVVMIFSLPTEALLAVLSLILIVVEKEGCEDGG
jgi:hypothetical protein